MLRAVQSALILEFYSAESWSRIYGEAEASEAVVYRVADLSLTGQFSTGSIRAQLPARATQGKSRLYRQPAGRLRRLYGVY